MGHGGSAQARIAVWIHGLQGRMGTEIQKALATHSCCQLLGGSDAGHSADLADRLAGAELILDFSTAEGNSELVQILHKSTFKGAIVVGTTGLSENQVGEWRSVTQKRKLKALMAPNTSIGILAATHALKTVSRLLADKGFDVELVETHHRAKKDAPSGTARLLAAAVCDVVPELLPTSQRSGARLSKELGIHSVRGGGVFGEHEVRFLSDHEEVAISHRAFSRTLFAQGALTLGQWLVRQPQGFYSLTDIDPATL